MADTGGYVRRKSSRLCNRCRPCTYRRCAGCNRMCSKDPGKHGENERRRTAARVHTRYGTDAKETRVQLCGTCVRNPRSFIFFFFFQLVEKYECVRARWMCTALKRGQSHCENAFISAFNVYIVHDIGFGSLEIFSGM